MMRKCNVKIGRDYLRLTLEMEDMLVKLDAFSKKQ